MADTRTLYVGTGRCLYAIPVPRKQKIIVSDAVRRLQGARDVEIVMVCSAQWPAKSEEVFRIIKHAVNRSGVTVRAADCLEERERLAAAEEGDHD